MAQEEKDPSSNEVFASAESSLVKDIFHETFQTRDERDEDTSRKENESEGQKSPIPTKSSWWSNYIPSRTTGICIAAASALAIGSAYYFTQDASYTDYTAQISSAISTAYSYCASGVSSLAGRTGSMVSGWFGGMSGTPTDTMKQTLDPGGVEGSSFASSMCGVESSAASVVGRAGRGVWRTLALLSPGRDMDMRSSMRDRDVLELDSLYE